MLCCHLIAQWQFAIVKLLLLQLPLKRWVKRMRRTMRWCNYWWCLWRAQAPKQHNQPNQCWWQSQQFSGKCRDCYRTINASCTLKVIRHPTVGSALGRQCHFGILNGKAGACRHCPNFNYLPCSLARSTWFASTCLIQKHHHSGGRQNSSEHKTSKAVQWYVWWYDPDKEDDDHHGGEMTMLTRNHPTRNHQQLTRVQSIPHYKLHHQPKHQPKKKAPLNYLRCKEGSKTTGTTRNAMKLMKIHLLLKPLIIMNAAVRWRTSAAGKVNICEPGTAASSAKKMKNTPQNKQYQVSRAIQTNVRSSVLELSEPMVWKHAEGQKVCQVQEEGYSGRLKTKKFEAVSSVDDRQTGDTSLFWKILRRSWSALLKDKNQRGQARQRRRRKLLIL